MEKLLLAADAFFTALPGKILRFKWPVLIAVAAGSIVLAIGMVTRTTINTSANSFLQADDPAIVALNKFRNQFGSDDSVVLVYRAKEGDIFSSEALAAVRSLTDDLSNWYALNPDEFFDVTGNPALDTAQLSHIRRVRSLANIRAQTADGDTLRSQHLIPDKLPAEPQAMAAIKAKTLANEDYQLAYYSSDGQYGAIVIQTDFGARTAEDYVPPINQSSVELDTSLAEGGGTTVLTYDETSSLQQTEYRKPTNQEYAEFAKSLELIYNRYDETLEFFPVGYPPLMAFVQEILQQTVALNIGMVVIIALLLWLLFRSLSAVVWPIVTIVLSIVWVVGSAAWLGIELSTMISLTLMLVFVCGIADCVHVISAYLQYRRDGDEHRWALAAAYGDTGWPMFVTCLTNMAGTSALMLAELIPIQVFALLSTAGIGFAYLFTLIVLPILLDLWHPHAPRQSPGRVNLIGRWRGLPLIAKSLLTSAYGAAAVAVCGPALGGFVLAITLLAYFAAFYQDRLFASVPSIAAKFPLRILVLFGVVFVLCLYGKSQLRVDSSLTELIREGSAMRNAYEIADRHMAGTQVMEIMIDTKTGDGLLHPELLKRMDALQQALKTRYSNEISRTYSLANVVKETHRLMHGDDPNFDTVPDSQLLITQLLYLYNSANPSDRRSLVADDFSQSHITLNVYSASSYQYKHFFAEIGELIDQTFSDLKPTFPDLEVTLTGSIPLMMRTQDIIATSQYGSFMLALAVISGIMMITLGSMQAGLIAIIPNLIPSLLTYGLMGLLDIPLDTDTLLLAPVIIGLSVDDTTHFIAHYRIALIKFRDMSKALRHTIFGVGPAVLSTGLVLGLGFAILSFSDYLGTAKMGFFGALSIFAGVLCELFLLPALILIFKPTFGHKHLDTTLQLKEQLL